MNKEYMIPITELVELPAVQLLTNSGVGSEGKGIGYGGVDNGTHEPSAPRYHGYDDDDEDEEDW